MTDDDRNGPSTVARIRNAFTRRFGVDPRALGAFRASLGVVLLVDVVLRARSLTTFYSDAGVLPRSALATLYPAFHSVSLHAISGAVWVQAALFLLAAGFAAALVVGYRTRLATFASVLLLVSLHARNPLVLNAGDVLLRRLLFWGVFLPLGARWAVDARGGERRREAVAGLATACLLIQVVLVYTTNVAFKLRGDAWIHGDAIRYVFNLDQFTVGFAPVALAYPALLEAAAWGWFALICSSVLLIVLTGRARTVLVSLFAGGHVGMLLTMDLGIFPLVSLVALLPFLPATVWDRVDDLTRPLAPTATRWRSTMSVPEFSFTFGRRTRALRSAVLATLLVVMLAVNVMATGVVAVPATVPDEIEDRSWNMFGNPPQSEGWYVAHGTFESGRQVRTSVASNRWDRPPDGQGIYPKARWRKYQSKLSRTDDEALRERLAADVCRRWTAAADEPLRSITIEYVRERTRLGEADQRESAEIGRYECVGDGGGS